MTNVKKRSSGVGEKTAPKIYKKLTISKIESIIKPTMEEAKYMLDACAEREKYMFKLARLNYNLSSITHIETDKEVAYRIYVANRKTYPENHPVVQRARDKYENSLDEEDDEDEEDNLDEDNLDRTII